MSNEKRWKRRGVASALIRLCVFCAPVAAGVVAGRAVASFLPPPLASSEVAVWWLLVLGGATVALVLVERLARRFLPLAWLLRMTLLFPTRAPRRWKLAVHVGTVRHLEERLAAAQAIGLNDTATNAAQKVITLITALQAHDRHTRGHAERVRVYTDMLTAELNLPERDRERIRWAALLHDIGKLSVPAPLLNKAGKPDAAEWQTIVRHPEEGARVCGPLLDWLGPWGDTIVQHHERYDGTGYPVGLSGTDIGMGARIVAVPDAYEVMTAPRAYKPAIPARAARQELADHAGSQFDPGIVRAFLNLNVRRLQWVAGPAAWLAQLPFFTRTPKVDPLPVSKGVAALALLLLLGLQVPAPTLFSVEEPLVLRPAAAAAAEPAPDVEVANGETQPATTPGTPQQAPRSLVVRPGPGDGVEPAPLPGGGREPVPDTGPPPVAPAPQPERTLRPIPEPEPKPRPDPRPEPEPEPNPDPDPTAPPEPPPTEVPPPPPPPAPAVAVADRATVATRETTTIPVLANDSGDLAGAVVTVLTQPQHGNATAAGGVVVYTAQPGWTGDVVFTYQVCAVAGSCASAPVTITVVR